MTVELIYDADCPNVPAARSQLIKAFMQTGVSARWQEWERGAPDAPEYARAYGSPAILVNGKDIAGVPPSTGTRACRVYSDARGNLNGAPSCEVEILDRHKPGVAKKAQQHGVKSVPAFAIDGKLADCCMGRGPDENQLRAAGIGVPL